MEQKILGDAALSRACEMLDEFDALGALFDDSKFMLIEKEAIAAQKHFKSAAAFSSEVKQKIIKVFGRITDNKEEIVKMRQGVQNGTSMVDEARGMTEDLARQFSLVRMFPTLSRSTSAVSVESSRDASRMGSRMSTPAMQNSPFEKPLRLLVDAKELFVKAKVKAPLQELCSTVDMLHTIAVERKDKHFKDGLSHVAASQNALQAATVSQNSDANEVENCIDDARKKLMLAKFAFGNGSYSDVVLEYYKHDPELSVRESDGATQEVLRPSAPAGESQTDLKANRLELNIHGHQICDDLEDEIEAEEEAWRKRHEHEVKEAFKCIEMCNEAVEKKAFNRAHECFKRANDLFKQTNNDALDAMRKALNQAEMKDRTLSKQIKGEAQAKSEQARSALDDGQLELAVITVEDALEMCHRCDDKDLMQAAEEIKTAAVSVANETYGTVASKLQVRQADLISTSHPF